MLTRRMSEPNNNPQPPEVIYGVPKVTCLCATKGRYQLLRSAVSYFMLQDYPNKELIIFNNHKVDIELSDFIKDQGNIHLVNAGEFDSISDVYNAALPYVDSFGGHPTEYVAIWDDDDIYLPWHLSTAVKYLNKGTHLAAQPRNQMYLDENLDFYPKIGAISNYCEGSLVVKKSVLDAHGFGPGESGAKQHPHPQWTSKLEGLIYDVPAEESGFIYFWADVNRGKPFYVHLQYGDETGIENTDTGKGHPLYPGPTYFDFVIKNLHLKKFNEEYTEEEKDALVDRINSYDWRFFEERKLFTFWEGEKPYFIEKCLESMEKNSNCEFEVWDTQKLKDAFPDVPKEYDSLCVEFKSDYARQRILYERGGMWLDADTFVLRDLYEPLMKHTWSYDQVQPLENNQSYSVNICAMACRPKSQVFKKALQSVNAVMPLHIGWGDLLNTPTKHAIRESHSRSLVKYIPEPVVSLRFVQSPHGGFNQIYSSTSIPLEEIVLSDTVAVTLHSSQIRHHQQGIMPKDYLLQRLIDKYLTSETVLPESITRLTDRMQTADLIRSLESPVIAEVGVQAGGFFSHLLTDNVKKAYGIDCWEKSTTDAQNDQGYSKEVLEGMYTSLVRNYLPDSRVQMIKEFSVAGSTLFPDEYFDFVYIDADHTYEGCLEDLVAWYPKVKKGGIIAGHDYIDIIGGQGVPFGVIQAVEEFSQQHNLEVHTTKEDFASYYMVKPGE